FEVIHTPSHTSDSICLYCAEEGVLFSGDASLIITSTDASYQENFVNALERIARRDIKAIYPGHGLPIIHGAKRLIYKSLDNVRKSKITKMPLPLAGDFSDSRG
ncbi:MAG: MBL fold metallo-hydrolase, partial [Desulfobacterales bacterium]|nr:MBL fold metallo-hydrolase [Desulfobacterales bacterium]